MMKKRQNNIEVLRVLCMFLIVVSHYVYHGLKQGTTAHLLGLYPLQVGTRLSFWDYSLMEVFYLISRVSVDCYVMITGYFLISRQTFRWKGLFGVWFQTFFYAVVIGLVFFSLGKLSSLERVLPYFTPIRSNAYWFITTYVGLLLLAPFVSKIAVSLSKRNYQYLLLIVFVMNFQPLFGVCYSNRIFQFVTLFLVGGYFQIYGIFNIWKRNSKIVYAIVLMSLYILATIYNWLRNTNGWELKSSEFNDIIVFLALATFVLFLSLECKSRICEVIVKLSPYTLGVYLIHDNDLIRSCLWEIALGNKNNMPMFLHCLLVSLLIFFICVFVDFMRSKIFKYFKINKCIDFISKKVPEVKV